VTDDAVDKIVQKLLDEETLSRQIVEAVNKAAEGIAAMDGKLFWASVVRWASYGVLADPPRYYGTPPSGSV
jgi:hypothetical protein